MIEALEIFKVVAGISFAGTGSYGVYYVINNNDLLSNSDSSTDSKNNIINDKKLVTGGDNRSVLVQDKYYIFELTTASTDKPSKELYEGDKKNFKCTFTVDKVKKEDLVCDIFLVEESKTDKLLNLDDYKKTTKKPTKDELTTKTPPLLVKIKSPILDAVHWEKVENIELDATDSGDSGKNYGKFTSKYLISGGNPVGKTNLFIGKFSENFKYKGTEDVTGKCSLGTKNTNNIPKECKIYKPKEELTESKNFKDIAFGEEIQSSSVETELKDGDLYVLDLKDNSLNIDALSGKTVNYYHDASTTVDEKNKASSWFTIVAFFSSTSNFTKDSKPIILA